MTFMTRWYYWAIVGTILIASGTPIGGKLLMKPGLSLEADLAVTIWKISKLTADMSRCLI